MNMHIIVYLFLISSNQNWTSKKIKSDGEEVTNFSTEAQKKNI